MTDSGQSVAVRRVHRLTWTKVSLHAASDALIRAHAPDSRSPGADDIATAHGHVLRALDDVNKSLDRAMKGHR
jgi:hypothetical protein